jgi:HKD family nuclease
MARNKRQNRLNIQDALANHVFHNAVLTTYKFDHLFFEEYCLEKYSSFTANNNISVIVDRSTYECLLSAPEAQQPKIANIRYLLHPVAVKGRFHPKLFLLTNKTSGKLVFGSANLTRFGLTSNAELVDQYDFEDGKNERLRYLFCDAFSFLNKVAELWQSETLTSNLQDLYRSTPWLHEIPPAGSDRLQFLHNLDRSLWSQLREIVPSRLDHVYVVSRFFDEQPLLLERLCHDWNPRKVSIYTQNGVTTMTPSWLKHPFVKSGRAEILFCTYEDEGYQQTLHGKSIIFVSGKSQWVIYGSANFTSAALICDAKRGNVETIIALPPLGTKVLDPKRFIDPCNSAHRPLNDNALRTDTREPLDSQKELRPVSLREAILASDRLSLYGEFPDNIVLSSIRTHLKIPSSPSQDLEMTLESKFCALSRVPERLLPVLKQKSSTVCLIDQITGEQLSNLVLVTNLVDVDTHESIMHERSFRGAKESAHRFFAVLNELLRDGDTTALLTFLSLCDIPLLNVPRLSAFRQRPVWEGREGMRLLGERNLQICRTLHEATLSFFDRHFKKLKQHTKTRMLDGISNFLHIFLSMGNLLRTQVERIVLGIESKTSPLTPREWADCRELCDIYFARFRMLLECLWNDYLKRMRYENGRKDIEREFGPDLEAIHDMCDEMIRFRERIKSLQRKGAIKFGYFHCVLADNRWKRFSNDVRAIQREVEFGVLGRNERAIPQIISL